MPRRIMWLALLVGLLGLPTSAAAQNGANGHLQIHYINVGQGDAELIISPQGQSLLIDSGPASALNCAGPTGIVSYLNSIQFTQLDVHIASSYDADHIGCTDAIVARWPVQISAIDRGVVNPPATPTYQRYAAAIAAKRQTAAVGETI